MKSQLTTILKTIQYKTGHSLKQIAENINYSRPHLNRAKNTGVDGKIVPLLKEFYKEILHDVIFDKKENDTSIEKAVTFERLLPELMGEYEERFIRIESQVEVHHLAIAALQAGNNDVLRFLDNLNKEAQIVARRRFHELGK